MTYRELEQVVQDLQDQVSNLTDQVTAMSDVANLSLDMQSALEARGFIRVDAALGAGTVYSNGDNTFKVITGAGGGVYVASISGASPTTFINFDTSGIRTT